MQKRASDFLSICSQEIHTFLQESQERHQTLTKQFCTPNCFLIHKIKNWQGSFRLPESFSRRSLEGLAFPSQVSPTRGGAAHSSATNLTVLSLPTQHFHPARLGPGPSALLCPHSADREMAWPHPHWIYLDGPAEILQGADAEFRLQGQAGSDPKNLIQ